MTYNLKSGSEQKFLPTGLGFPVFVSATIPTLATFPGIIVGAIWVDTTTSLVKRCTSLSPITFASIEGAASAPTDADYLVGTPSGSLSAEIVVGTTPGGELGNTWASPTVDATHSGSSHASIQSAAEATAASALSTHEADVTTHGITAAAATVLDDATVAAMVDTLGGAAATGTGGLVRATSPTLVTPTGIVKGDVGLGNVDNTSDAAKNAAVATLTNKTIDGASNTITNVGKLELLHVNSGTSTTVAAHNLDTKAISGLDSKDKLLIVVSLKQITQTAANVFGMRNDTDGVYVNDDIFNGIPSANRFASSMIIVQQSQEALTSILSISNGWFASSSGVGKVYGQQATFTQNWTGSWTLAFRSFGQTSGGTHQWTWAVYKMKGT